MGERRQEGKIIMSLLLTWELGWKSELKAQRYTKNELNKYTSEGQKQGNFISGSCPSLSEGHQEHQLPCFVYDEYVSMTLENP